MLSSRYLSLQLNRLKQPEEWHAGLDGIAFLLARGGDGQFIAGPSKQGFSAGDVLVISSASEGKLCVLKGREMVFWWFSLRFEHLYPLFANEEICLIQSLYDRFKSTRLYAASSPIATECHRLLAAAPPQYNLDHRSHILRVAATILSAEMAQLRPPSGSFVRVEDHLKLVFETLTFQEILTLSVQELAGRFSCSRRHLNRLFHQYFGLSVASLRMEMRLLKAASLLRDPDVKVINVAEQCGFNHLGLFNTCFRRRFGMSPGQWRNEPQGKRAEPVRLLNTDQQCPLRTNGLCPWAGDGSPCPEPPSLNGNGAKCLNGRTAHQSGIGKTPVPARFGFRP
jgi:AraC-like DNA-binding protein